MRFKIDGRYFLFASHVLLLTFAYEYYNLARYPAQLFFAFLSAVVTELVLHVWLRKYPNASYFDRILSAISEAAGLLLLVKSPLIAYYAIGSSIAVASKYVFTRRDGIHIFNPTNFAIIFTLAVIPLDYFAIFNDEYSIYLYPMLHVLFWGSLAIYFGRSVGITLGYFGTLVVCGLVVACFRKYAFAGLVFPEIGAFGLIFGFLMITDPKTTPRRFLFQIPFGAAIALGVLALRYATVIYPQFISYFVVTILTYALSLIFPQVYQGRSIEIQSGPADFTPAAAS